MVWSRTGCYGTNMDDARYGQLLAEVRPGLIDSPEEHDRLLTAAEQLMEKGSALSEEENKLLELLVILIKMFENSVLAEEEEDEGEDEPASALPHETLGRLLQARGLETSDIEHVFGNPAACREVLSGAKKISRGQAKALAKLFQVPSRLFQM